MCVQGDVTLGSKRWVGGLTAGLGGLLAMFAVAPACSASMTVLVGEPYGNFGTMMPNGHTAVYLDRVCADGPLRLRMCVAGEQPGVVIARYRQLGKYDWMATPVMEFLYASERADEVPESVTKAEVAELRERYRRGYLREIVPDGAGDAKTTEEWKETAGAAFDRRLWGYEVATTREQDEALVERMNDLPNRHRYHLKGANCADFAADVVNFYLPGAVERNRVADFGVMSPKQVARRLWAYGEAHPEVSVRVLEIPQIAGTLRRSRPVRGGAEALVKTKRYLATLLVIQPEAPVALEVMYLCSGRWTVGKGAEVVGPEAFGGVVATARGTGTGRGDEGLAF